jgi:hypothetical protein
MESTRQQGAPTRSFASLPPRVVGFESVDQLESELRSTQFFEDFRQQITATRDALEKARREPGAGGT